MTTKFDEFKKRIDRKHDPDPTDLAIMLELKKYPPANITEMSKSCNRTVSTISQRLDWLIRNGYVKIADGMKSNQARSKVLTEKGFEYVGSATQG